MKIKYNFVFLILFCFSLFSCVSLGTLKKDFYTFKEPLLIYDTAFPIRINGVYLPKNELNGYPFFFFKDGSITWYTWGIDFRQNCYDALEKSPFLESSISKEYWGHYTIKNDTIVIQVFNRVGDFIYKRWIFEFTGLIQNDSSFILVSEYSYFTKDQFIEKPIPYYYCPTKIKPDSTKAWFNDKQWFRENLHESRK
jgi:hypothetical protein